MPNTKNIKQVEVLTDKLGRAKAIYFTEYLGLNVEDITELRRDFHKSDVEYEVAKNTLLKLAAKNNGLEGMDQYLSGPTAIALSYKDPTSPARVLKNFTKDHELPEVKAIYFDGDLLDGSELKRIAEMPTKEELLAMFAALMNSSMTKLARTLQAPMANVGYALRNLKEHKTN